MSQSPGFEPIEGMFEVGTSHDSGIRDSYFEIVNSPMYEQGQGGDHSHTWGCQRHNNGSNGRRGVGRDRDRGE